MDVVFHVCANWLLSAPYMSGNGMSMVVGLTLLIFFHSRSTELLDSLVILNIIHDIDSCISSIL
jgi:hypothetical protein